MKILLVSLGSIGRRHLANARSIEPGAYLTVWRRAGSGGDVAGADRVVQDLAQALDPLPEAAIVAGPSSQHVDIGLELAKRGVHLLIEKPLSNRLEGTDDLIRECASRALVLMVGYNFRFYRPLQAMRTALLEGGIGRVLAVRAEVGQYLPDWRPGSDYRKSASARAELGGGAVLELSHEIDYVRWLVGEVRTVSARLARVSDLEIDVEDTAEIVLDFQSGSLASIHLDMVQRVPTRTCRIAGSEGVLEWDGIGHRVRLQRAGQQGWKELWREDSSFDRNEMYLEEMRHFLDCVRNGKPPRIGGEEARRVLEIALAAKRSSREGRSVNV
ncbi:MAG: Gfo/Idh/MocA family oxidoreductase [Verrucomicrobiota bacterium]